MKVASGAAPNVPAEKPRAADPLQPLWSGLDWFEHSVQGAFQQGMDAVNGVTHTFDLPPKVDGLHKAGDKFGATLGGDISIGLFKAMAKGTFDMVKNKDGTITVGVSGDLGAGLAKQLKGAKSGMFSAS